MDRFMRKRAQSSSSSSSSSWRRYQLFCVLLLLMFVIGCHCQEEEGSDTNNRPKPKAVISGKDDTMMTLIEEPTFAKRCGSYYSSSSASDDNTKNDHHCDTSFFVLNDKPVLYVPSFLNESLAEELKSFCTSAGRFVQSSIGGYGDGSKVQKNELRTSESCFLVPAVAYLENPRFQAMVRDDPTNPQVAKIAREVYVSMHIAEQASKLLDVDPKTVEALQLVRYTTPDAEYKLHHDHGGYYGKTTEHRPWTMLIFLNDVSDGGHTAFPELGLEVVPRGGDALVWSNTLQDSSADPDMVHMGKPPSKEGVEKYAVNVWFGEKSFAQRTAEREL